MHRHYHARTLMFANAASVLTQAVVRILKFGVLLASSSFTGCSATLALPLGLVEFAFALPREFHPQRLR
jgi:hypothetical protein